MKKTLHINLNGFAFHIEEDAYEKLRLYLEKIEKSFVDKIEAKEIVADIEARIAELFSGSHQSNEDVITLGQVDEVIKTMGEPQDFIDDEEPEKTTSEEKQSTMNSPTYKKRLYRDTENRVLGGVCGGLGAYFDMDPLVFRVIFLVAFILYGMSLPVYLILWIVMPKAITITQRLEMKGPAEYENWEQNLKKEYQEVSEKIKQSKTYQNINSGISKGSDTMGMALSKVVGFLGSLIGVAIMIGTLAALVGLVLTFTFGYTFFDFSNVSGYYATLPNYFLSSLDITLGTIGVLLLVVIPILMVFYLGFKLVFKFKTRGGLLALIGLILWISGWVLVVYTAARVARNYSVPETVYSKSVLNEPTGNTIYLKPNAKSNFPDYQEHLFDVNRLDVYLADDRIYVQGNPKIELVRGSEFAIDIKKSAKGNSISNAQANIDGIEYFWLQKDTVIYIDPVFTLQEGSKIRDQKLQLVLTVPEGIQVEVDDDLQWVVNNNLD
ncbi:PspC domain-containing protein [Labilibacter sediminis]|nr:PspC domain-containing protein [Labilibacter sediminis]